MIMPETLTLAVCLCDDVTLSDFIPPMEVLGVLNAADRAEYAAFMGDIPYRLKIDYLAPTSKAVSPSVLGLPHITPTLTYAEAIQKGLQYDIIWVPAGPTPHPQLGDVTPKEEINFIKRQAPGAKYIMSVCGGSLILGSAGVLDGKRATTNKMFYHHVVAASSNKINWVPKARWVIDGNIWTSSGVSAGTDMALAFLEYLVDKKTATLVRGMIEIPEGGGSEDDPFAVVHGLV